MPRLKVCTHDEVMVERLVAMVQTGLPWRLFRPDADSNYDDPAHRVRVTQGAQWRLNSRCVIMLEARPDLDILCEATRKGGRVPSPDEVVQVDSVSVELQMRSGEPFVEVDGRMPGRACFHVDMNGDCVTPDAMLDIAWLARIGRLLALRCEPLFRARLRAAKKALA